MDLFHQAVIDKTLIRSRSNSCKPRAASAEKYPAGILASPPVGRNGLPLPAISTAPPALSTVDPRLAVMFCVLMHGALSMPAAAETSLR